ncbi:MAG TPA: hypothetical protein VFH26_03450 [Gemmatimonadales bacterium]|nr:hypothetical protein [Gemmatimonadales bacterium]
MSDRCVRSNLRRPLLGVAVALALSTLAQSAGAQVQSLTAGEAGDRIRYDTGARVVLLYSTTCRYSHQMFPEVVRLSQRYGPLGVRFLAFNIDRTSDDVDAYLTSVGYLFNRLHILPWRPGELVAAMAPSGIDVRGHFGTPLIAVIDAHGQLVGQETGASGARRADRWLQSLGFRPAVD